MERDRRISVIVTRVSHRPILQIPGIGEWGVQIKKRTELPPGVDHVDPNDRSLKHRYDIGFYALSHRDKPIK
ncbi:MAG: hypothetical protein HYY87_04100 [Candidatus Levybacteria bacterium]|nr:hypothetical protein [Candidatus Levybacteria bacterium]MBI3093078.1 hypothetical protein [Candidatus Levybacteria bacterium]